MESINFIKGYGKVNPNLDDQTSHRQQPTSRKRLITASTISAILLTVVVGLLIAALIIHTNSESSDSPSVSSSSNSAESIKSVCSVTQHPTSCFASISSLNVPVKPDPESIFNLSLQVSIREVSNLSAQLKSVNDFKSRAAIDDCLTEFEDALSRLNDAALAMAVGPGQKILTPEKINDIQTWSSAAMTDQDTCLEGLEEMGSPVLDEVKDKMERSKESLSNSLAIIAKMQMLLEKFDLKMH